MENLDDIIENLRKYNQEYLLNNYNRLDDANKKIFTNQILNIDFDKQIKLFNSAKSTCKTHTAEVIKPVSTINIDELPKESLEEYLRIGKEQIINGKLAIVTLAGGQGTRLGHAGPKGTYMLLPNKSLFEILCDKLKEANEKYNTEIMWYIMTSSENNNDTINFFEKNDYFGYKKECIIFFKQNKLPMNFVDGNIVLNEKGLIKFGADGHGGIFKAMQNNNILSDMKRRKIEWLFVTPVDNPLVELVDPLFIGIAKSEKYEFFCKSVLKNPGQKSGVYCIKNNKLNVLEYTEISSELANKKDTEGNLFLANAHINCNMFNINAIDKILDIETPYHVAKKKTKYLNENGEIITPIEPNAYKYEKFIFDYFPYLDKAGIYSVKRENEYEPIKDNAEKARIAYLKKKGDC